MVSVLLEKLAEPRNQPLFLLFRPTFLHNHQYRNPGVGMDWDHALIRTRQYEYESPAGVMRTGVLLRRRRDVSADREAQAEREIYRAQLRYGDASLDKVLDRLEDDYAGNSIIVLYANHGSGLGDNGVYRHGTAYQSSIHVPLLIRHPAVREAIHVRRPVQLLDLVPAIVEMTMPADEQGTDAIERLLGIAGDPDAETIIFGRNSFDEFVRRGDWKLIIKYGRIKMLFNLRDDPGEAVNQIESRTDVARELERLLLEHRRNLLSKLIIPSVDAGLPG
jgi:arylsulfatase A-like enzyme